MINYPPTPEGRDPHLWHIAVKRASFRRHFAVYIIMNIFFWLLWYFIRDRQYVSGSDFPWPVWPMLGWGIGIAFHYFSAYKGGGNSAVENEYRKLTNKK